MLSTSVLKYILGQKIDFEDLEEYDLEMYKSLNMLDNMSDEDLQDAEITYSVTEETNGLKQTVFLCSHGSTTYVTTDKVADYKKKLYVGSTLLTLEQDIYYEIVD